jgi:hypothetical protein
MNRRAIALGIVQLLLLGLSLKSCTVSLEEPFKEVRVRDLWWQVISPAIVMTSMVWLGAAIAAGFPLNGLRRRWKVLWLAFIVVMLIASLEPIYGYLWDMNYHMGIR